MSGDSQQGGATTRTATPIDAPVRAVDRGDTMATYDLLDRLCAGEGKSLARRVCR
jgi:hypothetical protein